MEVDLLTVECSACGHVFEPQTREVDKYGEHWTTCPDCKAKVPLAAVTPD